MGELIIQPTQLVCLISRSYWGLRWLLVFFIVQWRTRRKCRLNGPRFGARRARAVNARGHFTRHRALFSCGIAAPFGVLVWNGELSLLPKYTCLWLNMARFAVATVAWQNALCKLCRTAKWRALWHYTGTIESSVQFSIPFTPSWKVVSRASPQGRIGAILGERDDQLKSHLLFR